MSPRVRQVLFDAIPFHCPEEFGKYTANWPWHIDELRRTRVFASLMYLEVTTCHSSISLLLRHYLAFCALNDSHDCTNSHYANILPSTPNLTQESSRNTYAYIFISLFLAMNLWKHWADASLAFFHFLIVVLHISGISNVWSTISITLLHSS